MASSTARAGSAHLGLTRDITERRTAELALGERTAARARRKGGPRWQLRTTLIRRSCRLDGRPSTAFLKQLPR